MAIIKLNNNLGKKFITKKITKTTKRTKNTKKKSLSDFNRRPLSLSQLLKRTRQQLLKNFSFSVKPILPPKFFVTILRFKPRKLTYNERIIDYKNCALLQRYIGLSGKILRRHGTKLSSKNQRFMAKTIKTSRVLGLLPFVSKEKGFFR